MKSFSISVNKIDEFLKLEKMQRELAVRLRIYNEQKELQLKRHQEIANLAQELSYFKKNEYKDWFLQLNPEIKTLIQKYRIK